MRILLIFLFLSNTLISQSFSEPLNFLKEDNRIMLSTDKFQNIYNFSNHFQYTDKSNYGIVHIIQNYTGNGTPTANNRSYQENQNLKFQYVYELNSMWSLFNRNNWFLSGNTLNFGQNKLERLNFLIGGKFELSDSKWIDVGFGKERNTTIGLETIGDYISSNYRYSDLEIQGFNINSEGYYENVQLNDGRINNDLKIDFKTNKEFDDQSIFMMNINYQNRVRDNPEINPLISDILIRRRNQSRINSISSIYFSLSNNLVNQFTVGLNSENVSNRFNDNYSEIQDSEFKRVINIFQYDIQNTITYNNNITNSKLYINYRKLNENYEAVNILNISEEKYETYRLEQNRQDKIETFFKIDLESEVQISNTDSIIFTIDYRLLQYDTPSEKNNDDRDEQLINLKLEYLKKINNNLYMGLDLETRNYHYVYLKSQRSSSNNWNRILRLSPTFILNFDGLYYKPKIGINANYTTYDFENKITAVNSFSFREIAYFDTLQINLSKGLNIETNSQLKYSERGILYWNSFSERPQRSNFEYFQNLLLIKREENNNLGIGLRYFKRKDTRLGKSSLTVSKVLNDFESVAPQFLFIYKFESGNRINFDFWYEFQTINQVINQELINFYLTLNLII